MVCGAMTDFCYIQQSKYLCSQKKQSSQIGIELTFPVILRQDGQEANPRGV